MFDWVGVQDRLHRLSKKQLAQFLTGPDKGDVYGLGFFCDAYDGIVYLVANTEQYHLSSLRDFEVHFGQIDPDVFRWNIGNWKYPGGLFPSSSVEQQQFDADWEGDRERLSQIEGDKKQAMLEELCIEVLMRLFNEGTFSAASGLTGLIVLGPDEPRENVFEKKQRIDRLLQRNGWPK